MLDRIRTLLAPDRRQALYGLLRALTALVVMLGLTTQTAADSWVALAIAVVDVLALALASWHAQRLDMTALYATASALGAGLSAVGIVTGGQVDTVLKLVAAMITIGGLQLARARTDATTPTGEPAPEYLARHL